MNRIKKINLFKVPKKNCKWWTLYAISACLAMLNLDSTAVAVILPKLYHTLGMNQVMQQWVINIYLLFLGVLMIIGGKISDLIGNRKAFFIGLSGFLFASLVCGFAFNGYSLLLGRALQGIFGAILMPNTAVVILKAFPRYERATAIGIYAGASALFLALGPLIGGFCTQFLNWRFVFWLNLPLGFLSIFTALRTIPRFKKKIAKISIDWLGLSLLVVASSSLLIALMEGVDFGWSSFFIISLFILSVISYVIFALFEQCIKNPLIDFNILREKNYLFTCIVVIFVEIGIISRVFWVLFFQLGLSYSPFMAGLLIIPSVAINMVLSPISGRLIDKYGPRLPITIGLIFLFVGVLWISLAANFFNYTQVIYGTILSGVGLAMTGSMSAVALANIQEENRSMAYATYQQIRQFGGTIGFAIIGAIITNLDTYYFKTNPTVLGLPFVQQISIDKILSLTPNDLNKTFYGISKNVIPIVHKIAIASYAKAFGYSMLFVAIFSLIGLYFSITKLDKNPQH